MPLEIHCDCTLCNVEAGLLAQLARTDTNAVGELFSPFPTLFEHPSVSGLLLHLRMSPADARSDGLLREMFELRKTNASFVENMLVLIFLPMLHRTIRRVSRQQPSLTEEDITQQALSFLLQFLHSAELETRQSHFAFAISRGVKRQLFEWTSRESAKTAILSHPESERLFALAIEDSFERYTFLRHFLHRCVTRGLLADSEVELLIQFKLDGNTGDELAALNGSSSNAVRQRFKRLLAKLRRLARELPSRHCRT
jgi:DNA-directed RNA polymerase specialized sigma24 family protein